MCDEVDFIRRGVNEGEGVGGFVADGGHADGAIVEEVVEERRLFEGDVFDAREFDDVDGSGEEGLDGVVEDAFVGDEEFVSEVDSAGDEAAEEQDDVK